MSFLNISTCQSAETMSSLRSDLILAKIDHFDQLPDSILVFILNQIGDVKTLGRCSILSHRFRTLVSQVEDVIVRIDCIISDDDASSCSGSAYESHGPFFDLFHVFFGGIVKPLQALGQLWGTNCFNPRSRLGSSSSLSVMDEDGGEIDQVGVTHHSPTQVLKNFNEIRFLKIELPAAELGIDEGVLLKWRADFGSTLDNCVILGASSVIYPCVKQDNESNGPGTINAEDNGCIPESFYTNGGLKLRVVWTISSLIAASARHYLIQPIISEHKTLNKLVLTDADGQGVLCMNKDQMEELRVKPLSASSASKRTLVPALNMRLWFAPHLELPNGFVLRGATLIAIRPSNQSLTKIETPDLSWVSNAFEEPFDKAAKMLMKRRTYCLEMNSF